MSIYKENVKDYIIMDISFIFILYWPRQYIVILYTEYIVILYTEYIVILYTEYIVILYTEYIVVVGL